MTTETPVRKRRRNQPATGEEWLARAPRTDEQGLARLPGHAAGSKPIPARTSRSPASLTRASS